MIRPLVLAVTLVGLVSVSRPAAAACTNDIDCPGTACGSDTCDWDKNMTCQPAGGTNKGWCAHDTDCKCMGMGATCVVPYCTFTTPKSGSGGAGGGAGGAAGAGTAGTTGSGGHAGTTGAAGTGTTGTAGTGTTTGGGGGGCAIAGSGSSGLALLGLALFAGGLARRRRRG
jgi:MYXO-CTERM domain-containing protein